MRYALWGAFGTLNFGNEVTLRAVIENIPKFDRAASFLIVAAQPGEATLEHGIDAVPVCNDPHMGLPAASTGARFPRRLWREIRDLARVRRVLRSVDVLVIAGTGMLYEVGEGVLGWPFQLFKWCALAKRAGKPVIFLSVGADGLAGKGTMVSPRVRIRRHFGLAFLTRSLSYAQYRSYRDPLSRQRVTAVLAAAAKDPIAPDLAFSLPNELLPQREHAPDGKRVVGVGLYAVDGPPPTVEIYLAMMERLVLRLHERGYSVRLLIGDASFDSSTLDALSRRLARRLEARVEAVQLRDFGELLRHVAECDALIATRYHNLLLAMMLGTPVISLSHMAKNDELMKLMALSDYSIPLLTANGEQIMRRLDDLLAKSEEVRLQLRLRSAQCATSLDEQYRFVVQLCRRLVESEANPEVHPEQGL